MYPTLFELGPIRLSTFLVFMSIALFFGLFVLWKRGRELYFDEGQLFDSVWGLLLVFLVGARIGYVITNIKVLGLQVLVWINMISRPGFIYITGFLAMILAVMLQSRRRRFDVYSYGDALSVAWSLVLACASLGLFFSGSGSGKVTSSFIGVQYPGLYDERIPVQLFSFVLYLSLFVLLWWLENRYRTIDWYKGSKSEAHSGFILGVFLVAHGLIELMLTPLRPGKLQFFFNLEYIIYFALVILGLYVLYRRSDLDWSKVNRRHKWVTPRTQKKRFSKFT